MEKKVAIIILTCNQKELVKKCLLSIKSNNYKKYRVYLADDSGTGEIGKYIKKEFRWVNVTINSKQIGYSKSNNILIKKSINDFSPDYILHLDDDTEIIDKDFLKHMIEIGEQDERIGILGCKLVYPDGNLQWFYKNGRMNFIKRSKKIGETPETSRIEEVSTIIGACFLIKKKVLDEIGLFDEGFSPLYGEETDLCYRAKKRSFKMIYVGNAKVIHHGSASKKKLENDGGKWFLQKRGGIRIEWLNFNTSDIIKHTIIHFGSAILSRNPFQKTRLLLKAYKENLNNLKEIRQKRKERFSWQRV